MNFFGMISNILMISLKQAKLEGNLSISQRQGVIKLLEKKRQRQRYIKNWRPIFLLSADAKLLSKTFAAKLKPILPSIISSDQTVHVGKRCISQSGRLISDIMEIGGKKNIPGYLVILKKFSFGDKFINWINSQGTDVLSR